MFPSHGEDRLRRRDVVVGSVVDVARHLESHSEIAFGGRQSVSVTHEFIVADSSPTRMNLGQFYIASRRYCVIETFQAVVRLTNL